jgi:hypothetical protein
MFERTIGAFVMTLAFGACGGGQVGPWSRTSGALFTPKEASVARPFYARRLAEQANPSVFDDAARVLRFRLDSHAISYADVGSDDQITPRFESAVPMGIVNGNLAVLTSRCLVDCAYPLKAGQPNPRFRNLAIFNGDGREPRTVFMLASVPGRPEMNATRDPRDAHWIFDSRFYLEGPAGDRYFNVLASGRLLGVSAELVQGQWNTNEGIDLVMLYFPLSDPGVSALRFPNAQGEFASLGLVDPMAVVRAAMVGRTEYLQTFSFRMITPQCLHAAEAQLQHAEHEARLWKGIAIVAAAAALLPLLGPAIAAAGGLVGFAADVASVTAETIGPKILAGLAPAAWHVASRVLKGEQLADVVWDEGGHLVINALIDGVSRRLRVAGIRRGRVNEAVASRVLDTVKEFARDQAVQLFVDSASGHVDVASLVRPDVGADLSSELLAGGAAALDIEDRQVLARQPTLIRAAAYALQGTRGPATEDDGYQRSIQQLSANLDR